MQQTDEVMKNEHDFESSKDQSEKSTVNIVAYGMMGLQETDSVGSRQWDPRSPTMLQVSHGRFIQKRRRGYRGCLWVKELKKKKRGGMGPLIGRACAGGGHATPTTVGMCPLPAASDSLSCCPQAPWAGRGGA